jgi:hypothetical protein
MANSLECEHLARYYYQFIATNTQLKCTTAYSSLTANKQAAIAHQYLLKLRKNDSDKEVIMPIQSKSTMGKVFTKLTITNRTDQVLAEDGVIPEEKIRSITLKNVLANKRVTTLCLPSDAIASLGLKILKEVDVATAMGIGKARIFRDATLSILGREGTFECLELPGGADALLGVIPLEALGLDIDVQNQTLKPLPISPTDIYLTIL